MTCFVDTVYLMALLNSRDQHHDRASRWATSIRGQSVVTSQWVLAELFNGFSAPRWREGVVELYQALRSDPLVEIVPADAELFVEGVELFRARPDKDWSLTDCTSFTIMSHGKLTAALTTDRHFVQAGFHALLLQEPPVS